MWTVWVIVAGLAFGGQDSFARAKELYAAAAYDDALGILETLQKAPLPAADARDVAVYRVFCLLALDRDQDAVKGIEAIVRADPLFRPTEAQASPRLRTRFNDVRTPLLPVIIKERYTAARAQLDRRELPAAIAGFEMVIALAKEAGPLNPDYLSLATGYRDLARTAAQAEPPPAIPVAGRVYGPETAGISAPVATSNPMPELPPGISVGSGELDGLIELVIDQAGRVRSARMLKTLLPGYDEVVVEAAKKWQFRPAFLGRSPVLYRHAMVVTLRH
jgi:tetratricopeptide (TPR) repeat protein